MLNIILVSIYITPPNYLTKDTRDTIDLGESARQTIFPSIAVDSHP